MSRRSITLDLHPIYNKGDKINEALYEAFEEAERKKAKELEIIHGKGSGQLKKRILRFLDQKEIKEKYSRLKKDPKNSGRVFVYFKWK